MPIRIVHTADNHIGLPFKQYPTDIRSQLVEERFAALSRLVDEANTRKADFFVVAGDLFDSTRVKAAAIDQTVGILRGFAGEGVLVVPGNHDYFAGPETEVWKRFRQAIDGVPTIDLLTTAAVKTYEIAGQSVHFFPCPCPAKTGRESTIGWVADAASEHSDGLCIGIAHGNVPGLGLDAADQYFTMEPASLEAAGMATWLLGHIHVPFPTTPTGTQSSFFMAGTHTPDSLRCSHAGSAWWIECDENRLTHYERLTPGQIRFVRLKHELLSGHDIETLTRSCQALDAAATILDLQLSGRLSADERADLEAAIDRLRPGFLNVSVESDIHDRLDAARIREQFRSGGLAERLLTALLAENDHPDAATLAYELIEEASKP